MWKSPPKRTTRSTKESVGCMHGLFNVFYVQRGKNSRKLLDDKPRRSVLSFRTWYSKKKNKLKLLTGGEEKLERSNDGHHEIGKGDLDSSSSNAHIGRRIPKIKGSTNVGSDQVIPDSGSSLQVENNMKHTCETSAIASREVGNSARVTTSSESNKSQLSKQDKGFSSNNDLAVLLEKIYDDKHKDQQSVGSKNGICSYPPKKKTNEACTCLGQLDVHLLKDDPVLQETLDEVLEEILPDKFSDPSESTSDVVTRQSEELVKLLETLKSNKELLIKVLQDPKILNLFLEKQIQVVPDINSDKIHTAESCKLEDLELFESKCGINSMENMSNESDISQKLSRIVVLKPNPVRNKKSSDVIDPGSPSQSSQSSSPSMEEFLPFHFLIQQIKKRLKKVFGVSQNNQQMTQMDEGSSKMPYGSKGSDSIKEQMVDNFKEADSIGSSSSELASQTAGQNSRSREQKSCEVHGVSPYSNDRNKCQSTKRQPRKAEDLLDVAGYGQSIAEVSHGEGKNAFMPSQQVLCSMQSPGRETITCQLVQSDKKLESLSEAITKLPTPDLGPKFLDSHKQDIDSSTETSDPEDFKKIINEISTEYIQDDGCSDVISECNTKRSVDCSEQRQHDKFTPCLGLDLSGEQGTPEISSIINSPNIGSPVGSKKPELPSPVSVLDSLLLDKIVKPGSIKSERDEFRISPRKIPFEDGDDFKVATASPKLETKLQTCVGDNEFKFGYMRALLEASSLCHSDTPKRDNSSQLLDPSLYDEIETPSEEIPDDLKVLFDCINEVLEEIFENSSSIMPWLSFIKPYLQPFPAGEQLIQQVQRGLNIHFIPWFPTTLEGIVKKDLDIRMWMDLRSGVEGIGIVMGDEILDKILEEAILELLA